MSVPEAPMDRTEHGLEPAGPGWFVLNLADAQFEGSARQGRWSVLETRENPFPQFGINVHIVEPGQANALYHAETNQEGFLVLHGECLLVVEEQERHLRQWDFMHFPPGTRHVVVGAGDGPCAILMVGTRNEDETLTYPVSEVAAKHGASAVEETNVPYEAYKGARWSPETSLEKSGWPLGQ